MSTPASPERDALTVSQVTREIKRLLEDGLRNIWVTGEISRFQRPNSGHWYFTLKDQTATLSAAMFRSANRRVKFEPEPGLRVNVFGTISVYDRQGSYQIIAERLEPVGLGALQLQLEQLKKKLAAEGLFDTDRKRPLPFLPSRVGIVTSRTGAAIRDMIHVLHRRRPHLSILVAPVRVQGPGAAAEIASGIRRLNEDGTVEVIIAGRGGGSLEDLWAFNEEIVARSIAASRIPVVSAVGHETDHTIADLVADLRAPTPSSAAERVIAVPELELRERVEQLEARTRSGLRRWVARRRQGLDNLQARLRDPRAVLAAQRLRVDELTERAQRALQAELKLGRNRVSGLTGRMDALSPLRVLQRGYAIATDAATGSVLRSVEQVRPGQGVRVRLAEGEFAATVTGGGRPAGGRGKKSTDDDSQGELPL